MATVNGTSGNDFIHMEGDGHTPPVGFNEITGTTDSGDLIVPGAGADIVYCGSGDDTIRISAMSDIDGLAEAIDGGAGSDTLRFQAPVGAVDLTNATIANVEALFFAMASSEVDATLTPDQLSNFSLITATGFFSNKIIVSMPGTVDFAKPNAAIFSVSDIVGSSGDDTFKFVMRASNGTAIFGENGNDSISFKYSNEIPNDPQSFVLDGGNGDDKLTGGRAFFTLTGDDGNDKLTGGKLDDMLDGGADRDKLFGGRGEDFLTGGTGRDIFSFKASNETTSGTPDIITDFSHAEGDLIDLHKIDADTTQAGDQAFHLAGGSFSGSAGELIQFVDGPGHTILQGDVDGDGVQDFEIALNGTLSLVDADFVL